MGWRKAARIILSNQNKAERTARVNQRELERQRSLLSRIDEIERNRYEFQVYENSLEVISSLHKECSNNWDWKAIANSSPPIKPINLHEKEILAQNALDNFKPSAMDKLLKRDISKREQLLMAVKEAKRMDEEAYLEATKEFEIELNDWNELIDLARKIIQGDLDSYKEAFTKINPISEISEIGSSLEISFDTDYIVCKLYTRGEDVIPAESKTLLKSGKLSIKKISNTQFYELYQDYICSAILRVARELFAILPVNSVFITAIGSLLNTQTGQFEEKPILSVVIPRSTLDRLNFEMIDPSDSMKNFIHRINFKVMKGFSEVEPISPDEIQFS